MMHDGRRVANQRFADSQFPGGDAYLRPMRSTFLRPCLPASGKAVPATPAYRGPRRRPRAPNHAGRGYDWASRFPWRPRARTGTTSSRSTAKPWCSVSMESPISSPALRQANDHQHFDTAGRVERFATDPAYRHCCRAVCTFTDKPVRGFSRASAPCLSHCRLEAWKVRCAHAMT